MKLERFCFLLVILGYLFLPLKIQAAELNIISAILPPNMNQQGEGREADIITETLASCGHSVQFKAQPFTRHWDTYRNNTQYDAVTTVPSDLELPGARSDIYIEYHNGLSTLKEANLKLSSLSDLKDLRVIAFKGAKDMLPGLKEIIPTMKSYKEDARQINQSRLLFAKRTNVVLGDGLIFAAYNADLRAQSQSESLGFNPNQQVTFKAMFKPNGLTMMFRNSNMRDEFNKCFRQLQTTGRIQKINTKYIDQYRNTVGREYLGN